MRLLESLSDENKSSWLAKGYELPKYNRDEIKANTKEHPTWIHFGAGNIFRAFPAEKLQELLNCGQYDRGLIVAESFDTEIIEKAYQPYDGLSLSVVLKANGTIDKKVIGSVVESLVASANHKEDYERIEEIFVNPSLQMVSFTITEKGYRLDDAKGSIFPFVEKGFEQGPKEQTHLMGIIASLLHKRFTDNQTPLAIVSMDNCSHNGDKLKAGVMAFVDEWSKRGLVSDEFVSYMNDKVSFPWSMIDKITPRPDADVKAMLEQDGFEDTDLIITNKNTYTAPFVNSEETGYLVIEDDFPNGRPALEKTGIIFTDKKTVDQVEKMKVCTCLNPLHTALAIFGCLLSYETIHDEMEDEDLKNLIVNMCYKEGMKVVVDPGVIKPMDFAKAVIEKRLPNPFMPDTPQRIATDTSQKIPIRFGETIKAYAASDVLKVTELNYIPLVLAGWCRYLMGINDEGAAFTQSPDPMLELVSGYVKDINLGDKIDVHEKLKPILSDASIFACDLYEVGLGDKVEKIFEEMIVDKGSIRKTIKKYM